MSATGGRRTHDDPAPEAGDDSRLGMRDHASHHARPV